MSAGYLQFDGDVLTLDKALVDAESRRCWRLVASVRRGDIAAVEELVAAYRGTYALDFAYEDWATSYRENLHAAVLGVVEVGVRAATRGRRSGACNHARSTGLGSRPRG